MKPAGLEMHVPTKGVHICARTGGVREAIPALDKAKSYHYCYNMHTKTKVRKIGNSYGILLSKEALQLLRVKEGDTLYLTEAPNSSVHLTSGDMSFDRKMQIAERGMKQYQNALRELAK
jgi:putative addiction module antidote